MGMLGASIDPMIETANPKRDSERDPEPDRHQCSVFHGPGIVPAEFGATSEALWRPIAGLGAAAVADEPAVLIVDASLVDGSAILPGAPSHVVVVAADAPSLRALRERAHVSLAGVTHATARRVVLDAACQLSCARLAALRRRRQIGRSNREIRELHRVGSALMHEHDRDSLLRLIIKMGKELTASDGAGILLSETADTGEQQLRAALYEFDSLPNVADLTGLTTGINHDTIVGHAAATQLPVVVDDAYQLPHDVDFKASQAFDERYRYHRRSALAVPMVDRLGHAVGVLLFINRKTEPGAVIRSREAADRYVVAYTSREVRLAESLGGQAAVAIENANLHAQIEHILEGVVRAAVTAIDQRDPATAGHSIRVAILADALADAVERTGTGRYRDVHFTRHERRELHYAALLHDFGKVTIREDVLTKAKKLPPFLWERVDARFDFIRRTMEVDYYKERERLVQARLAADPAMVELDKQLAEQIARLDAMRTVVTQANEPSVPETSIASALLDIARHSYERVDGTRAPYLTTEELRYLQVRHGTLDERERIEVESHAEETYQYLLRIPWTHDLKNVCAYAYEHHEKLNGTGYPRRLKGDEIPLQARIITLADMFDALTEADRPYRHAVSAEQALDIIQADADAGLLDSALVAIMAESQVYRRDIEEY